MSTDGVISGNRVIPYLTFYSPVCLLIVVSHLGFQRLPSVPSAPVEADRDTQHNIH